MALTFLGGIHIKGRKNTEKKQIEVITPPKTVILPMSQHMGVPAEPCVKVGDEVYKGQIIGTFADGVSSPVHSSVSGKVINIEERSCITGEKTCCIIIENDGLDRLSPHIKPWDKRLNDTSFEEIVDVIKNAGITEISKDNYPIYEKINLANGKVDKVIVNCAECEPYISANHRLLLENTDEVINGLKIILKALGVRSGIIAVQDSMLDAANLLEEKLVDSDLIKVKVLKTKYPQGNEHQLIYALTGKEIAAEKPLIDMGYIVFNLHTCAAIFKAFAYGIPLVERIVSVDGDCIKEPKNVLVPMGTTYKDLIDFCGGFVKTPYKLISGSAMTGIAVTDTEYSIVKNTTALLAFSKEYAIERENVFDCIRCGKCHYSCPMRLLPNYIIEFAAAGKFDKAEDFDVFSCIECGSCSYVCPANIPIAKYIRGAKSKITENKEPELSKGREEDAE